MVLQKFVLEVYFASPARQHRKATRTTMKHTSKRIQSICLAILFLLSIGCGSKKPAKYSHSTSAPGIEKYGRLPTISKVAISPNGAYIAHRNVSSEKDAVIVYDVRDKVPVNGLDVSEIDPRTVYFINNDTLILVVSQHKVLNNYARAMDISTAYAYQFKTGKFSQLLKPGRSLTRKAFIYRGQEGMGRVLGFSADKTHVFMPAFVASSERDPSPNYALLSVAVSGDEAPTIADAGTTYTINFFIDNQGVVVARELYRPRTEVHQLESKVDGDWRIVYESSSEQAERTFVGLTADSQSVVYLSHEEGEDFPTYYSMSLEDGVVYKLSDDESGKDIEFVIKDVNNVVLGVQYSGFVPSYQFFERRVQKRLESIQEGFPEHSVHLVDWSSEFVDIVVEVEGSTSAGDFYLFSDGQEPRLVASARPKLEESDVNPLGRLSYKARDGLSIPTLLTIPRNSVESMKNLPAVLMPHGGPAAHDSIGFDYMAQALASRGYLVVQPQFRGSAGFGREHMRAGFGEWGKKMQDDLTDAVKFLAKQGVVDPKRVCIAGASYGGYAALAGAAFTPNLYKCAFSLAGVSHLPSLLTAERRAHGYFSPALSYFKVTIGGGEFNDKKLEKISPFYFAKAVKIPVMLVHGEDDKVVDFEQSEMMYSALKDAGADVELVKLQDEDHHLIDQETRIQAVTALVEFVDRNIGVRK